jgi:hypothetical protein
MSAFHALRERKSFYGPAAAMLQTSRPASGDQEKRRQTNGAYRWNRRFGHGAAITMGRNGIKTGILRARTTDTVSVWIAAVLIPLFLIAPALWNGYPLLQWDTGGYLARWYEGYLVPSRSTVFGLYLHFGVDSDFWLNLGIQALATLWILQLCLRVLNLAQPFTARRRKMVRRRG